MLLCHPLAMSALGTSGVVGSGFRHHIHYPSFGNTSELTFLGINANVHMWLKASKFILRLCLQDVRRVPGVAPTLVRSASETSENAPSCVLTQAAIRDILSCPTYRCTVGSTLVSAFTVQSWFRWLRGGLGAPASSCHCQDTGDFWNAK